MKQTILLITACIALAFTNKSAAQTDSCITHLKDANTQAEQGNFDAAIGLLKNTLQNCPLDKADRIQANKLLIQCYLSVDNLEEADKAAQRIIRTDPNYSPDKFKDDAGIIKVFSKFRPKPVMAIGIYGGANFSLLHIVHNYSVVFPDGTAPASYKSKTGFQLGVMAERCVFNNLWVQLGFGYRNTAYQHDLYNIDSNTVNYKEVLSYVDIPINIKYEIGKGRFTPFVQAGIDLSVLTNALSTTTRIGDKDIVNRTAMRNSFSTGIFGGIGAAYRIKSLKLFAGVSYIYFADNVNKEGTRYSDQLNLFKYYYIDDDFRFDNLQISTGAAFIIAYRNSRN